MGSLVLIVRTAKATSCSKSRCRGTLLNWRWVIWRSVVSVWRSPSGNDMTLLFPGCSSLNAPCGSSMTLQGPETRLMVSDETTRYVSWTKKRTSPQRSSRWPWWPWNAPYYAEMWSPLSDSRDMVVYSGSWLSQALFLRPKIVKKFLVHQLESNARNL